MAWTLGASLGKKQLWAEEDWM